MKQPRVEVICKNCGNRFAGKFCNNCGEKVYHEHDKSVLHFFEEGFHFITHFEGTLFRTIRTIFTKPGMISWMYCYGIRKPYFKPISFFFLLVILYLLFPVFEGLNMNLKYHMIHNNYGTYATEKVNEVMQTSNLSYDEVQKTFHQKGEKISKFLLFILIPLTALFFWLCTFKKRKLFFDQMVFSAEINSVYLFWGFLILPLVLTLLQVFSKWISGSYLPITDGLSGSILYVVLCIYLAIAARRFYTLKLWQSILLTLAFVVVHRFIVQVIYKFILFYLAIRQVH